MERLCRQIDLGMRPPHVPGGRKRELLTSDHDPGREATAVAVDRSDHSAHRRTGLSKQPWRWCWHRHRCGSGGLASSHADVGGGSAPQARTREAVYMGGREGRTHAAKF